MGKLEIAKRIVKENYDDADCGIFNNRNLLGDGMINLYDDDGLQIDICYGYNYFEVFGLSTDEFAKLKEYYRSLGQKGQNNLL